MIFRPVVGQDYFAEEKSEMQFFGVSYGIGSNQWASFAKNYKLWDQSGIKILDGNSGMRARSHCELYGLEALLPIKKFRFGFGFNFEVIALYELKLHSENKIVAYSFPEIFRADKVYMTLERAVKTTKNGRGEIYLGVSPGLYSFSMIRSTSLFGETRTGRKWFLQLIGGYEYRVHDKLYANIKAIFDYKYFSNKTIEFDRRIRHNIYTFGLSAGMRLAFR